MIDREELRTSLLWHHGWIICAVDKKERLDQGGPAERYLSFTQQLAIAYQIGKGGGLDIIK